MSIHIIVQLLSDNTATHNMYLKMIVGTFADILFSLTNTYLVQRRSCAQTWSLPAMLAT
jgi:hypothetical protein